MLTFKLEYFGMFFKTISTVNAQSAEEIKDDLSKSHPWKKELDILMRMGNFESMGVEYLYRA